jgi:hypothetical protein
MRSMQLVKKKLQESEEKWNAVKTETGFTGTLKEFFNFIHTDKQFMPFKTGQLM